MDRQNRSFIERIIKSRKAQRRLKRIVALMAVFVLLWTTDALKMFASTMESESALDKVDVVEATAAEEAIFGEEDDGAEELLGDEAVDIDDDLDDQEVEDVALDTSLDSEDAEGSAEELTDVLLSDVSGDDPEDAEAFEADAAEPGVYAVSASGEGFEVEVIVDGGEPLPAGTALAAQWAETVEGRSGAVAQLCRALGVEGNTLPENMGAAFLNQSLLYAGGQIQPDGYVYVNVDLSDTVEIEGDAPDFRVVCLSDGTARVLGRDDFGVTLSGNHVKDFWYYDYAVTEVALVWTTAAHEVEVVEEEAPEVVEVVEDDAEVIEDAAIEAVTTDINNEEEAPAAVVEEAEPEEPEEADEAESEPEETENNETGEDEAAEVVEIEEEETAETEPEETEDEEAEEEPEVTEDEEGEEADAEETEDEASEEIEEGEEADAEETEEEESEEEPEETEDEEAEEAEPVTVAASADGIVVTIAGDIPAEAIPAAQLIEVDEAAAQAIDALLGEGAAENAVAFDITLTYEGEAIQPNGPVDVTVGIEEPIEMQAGEEGFRLVTLNGENSAVADAAFDSADALTGFAYTTDALGAVAVAGAPVAEEAEETEEPADEPEEEAEETEAEEAPAEPAVLYAEIDLTDAVPPLSLREMMAQAAPAAEEEAEPAEEVADEPVEEAEEVEEADAEVAAADWPLTFDEELFAVEPVEDDWLVTPLVNFESAEITVEAGEVYVLTLVNCVLYEEEPEEPEYPEQAFEASTETMTVTVTAPEGAFPAGTAMSVADVYDTATLDAITGAVEGENVAVKSVKAVDITFTNADGEEIQPLVPISVVMTPVEQPQLSEIQVVHVDGEGSASVVEQDAPEEGEAAPTEAPAVAFTAETFSVYAYVETIVYEYLSSNGQVYEVTVTYGTDANIPEGAQLRVTEFPADSDEYDYARKAVLADKLAKGEEVDIEDFNLAALDISILNAEGEEIEPEASVKVDLKIKSLPDVENLSEVADTLEVQHHVEVGNGVVVETVYGGSAEASFDQATNEEVVAAGTVVNPETVDEDALRRIAEAAREAAAPASEAPAYEEEEENTGYTAEYVCFDTSFAVDMFSTFTITWAGTPTNTTTSLRIRFRPNNTNRDRYVTVRYVDANGNPITRPNGIDGNTYVTTTNSTTEVVIANSLLGNGIPGREFIAAHYNSYNGDIITRMVGSRSGGTNYVTFYNGTTEVANVNYDNSNIYLVYSGNTSGNTVTVHYVDEDGNDLDVSNTGDGVFGDLTASSSSPAYLIYDIDGYEYDHTYRNTDTDANRIVPQLRYDNSQWRYGTATNSNPSTALNDGDEIFVVYKKKAAATTGGTSTASVEDETWPDEEEPARKPTFGKKSKNTHDGTNTISLSITAPEKPVSEPTKADIIVVFDVSDSMRRNMAGTQTYGTTNVTTAANINENARLHIARDAVNAMAETLLGKNVQYPNTIRMALITFSTTTAATPVQGFTTDAGVFTGKVDNLTANGGTNWEAALEKANSLQVRSDANTFIVFVSDGNPTFRESRGDYANNQFSNDLLADYYRTYGIYGNGNGATNSTTVSRCYDAALEVVEAIADEATNKSFYAIGVSTEGDRMSQLVSDVDLPVSDDLTKTHYFDGSDEDKLKQAFEALTAAISAKLGFGDIEITDGITDLTNTEMEVMTTIDPDSFTYYRFGGYNENGEYGKYGADEASKTEWTTIDADHCGRATYENGKVKWNMGDDFQLEDGVTYVVEFTAWPSQAAYDLVADLNNGIREYRVKTDESDTKGLTQDEYDQIVELDTDPVTYALKTNTEEVTAYYKKTTKTGDTVTISDNHPVEAEYLTPDLDNMALASTQLIIQKVFEDDLTGGSDRVKSVELVLLRREANKETPDDFAEYAVPQPTGTSSHIVLNEANNWQYKVWVAPGLQVGDHVLEHGYDFTVTEPVTEYHYDLIEETVNPMVERLAGEEDAIVHLHGDWDGDKALTAVNRVKSGIDIQKIVYDVDGETMIYPDTEFTITGKLLDPDGNPYPYPPTIMPSSGLPEDASGAYDIFVPDTSSTYHYPEHPYVIDGTTYDTYTRTEHKLHFDSTGNISFKLKAGEWYRFINVPEGCTFEFTEVTTDLDALGYQWVSTEAVTQHRTSPNGPFTPVGDVQPDVSDQTASLQGDKSVVGNKQYAVTYTNKRTIPLPEVELVKVDADDNTLKLNNAEFKLYADADKTKEVTVDGNGNPIAIKTGNKTGSEGPDGWYHIGLLPAGTYYMVETKQPDRYVLDDTPVIITVTKGTTSYSVIATKDGESVISGPTGGVYTITVDNEKAALWVAFKKVIAGSGTETDLSPLGGAEFNLTIPEGVDLNDIDMTSRPDDGIMVNGTGETAKVKYELPMNSSPYVLIETKAPDGYNMLTEKINVLVNNGTVSALGSNGTVFPVEEDGDGTEEKPFTVVVPNNPGKILPNTGGIGTTILYATGTALILLAIAMFIRGSRRRWNGEE